MEDVFFNKMYETNCIYRQIEIFFKKKGKKRRKGGCLANLSHISHIKKSKYITDLSVAHKISMLSK